LIRFTVDKTPQEKATVMYSGIGRLLPDIWVIQRGETWMCMRTTKTIPRGTKCNQQLWELSVPIITVVSIS